MKVRVIYDPILRTKVAPVTVFDATLKKEAAEMLKTMHSHNGIGLAGNQVGLNKRLIVFGYTPKKKDDDWPHISETALCNPELVKKTNKTDVANEGCLSLPGLELLVERAIGVTVKAQDLQGKTVTIKAKGLAARILQHEIDHLNGILFTDRAAEVNVLKHYAGARIVFFGSDDFSAPIFEQLIENGLQVMAVVTETDKPAGRGKTLQAPLMKEMAARHNVALFQPDTKEEISFILEQLRPDLIILASYGKILPAEALAIPVFGALNVHPSLLPKYRGATPIQTAILDGETETGVTIIQMSPAVDAGLIVAQEKMPVSPTDNFSSLKTKLAEIGGKLLVQTVPSYLSGQAKLLAQDEKQVTATKKLTKEMGEIDWAKSATDIDRQIRALNPWPGTFTWLNGSRLKILEAEIKREKLLPISVQLEGKKAAVWVDFARGHVSQLTKQPWYAKISQ